MRGWQLAAVMAAMMTTHVVPAFAEALAPAGLGGDGGPGGVLGVTAQPGKYLSKNFRLRADYALSMTGQSQPLRGSPRLRRVATMLDYYPDADSGFRLSAGMRFLARRIRPIGGTYHDSQVDLLTYAPAVTGRLPLRTNIARNAPAATMGWTRSLSDVASFGLEAGTIMEHGGALKTMGTIADSQLRTANWSRIDPVAQMAFAFKF